MNVERYSFVVENNDQIANLTRVYTLVYYVSDQTVEMFDLKTRKVFLKRCAYSELSQKELFIGATVNIFSRPLKIVDYGDERTRQCLSQESGQILVVVSESGLCKLGSIIDAFVARNLRIGKICMTYANTNVLKQCAPEIVSLSAQTSESRPRCVLILINGSRVAEKTREVCDAFNNNFVFISNVQNQEKLMNAVLSSSETTASFDHCAVCVIKPHAITSSHQGAILQRLIDEGFEISALASFTLSVADAEDFLEVYSGVLPEYKRLVEQLASGTCWAIEIRAENAVAALRAVCGPHDPEVCHVLFPNSLRDCYGIDRVRNSVHCTDLEEDGPLESEFFFSLMANKVPKEEVEV